MRSARLAICLIVLLTPRCASSYAGPGAVVQRYLAAQKLDEALSTFAPDYQLWFGARSGAGLDRARVATMLEWDYALSPRHRVNAFDVRGAEVTARVHEDNDFSLLIGFPGWDATSTYVVNGDGLIASQVLSPASPSGVRISTLRCSGSANITPTPSRASFRTASCRKHASPQSSGCGY